MNGVLHHRDCIETDALAGASLRLLLSVTRDQVAAGNREGLCSSITPWLQ